MTLIHSDAGYGALPYGLPPYLAPSRFAAGGFQVEVQRAFEARGFQIEVVKTVPYGFQANIVLYNTNNLRILHEFPSRGSSSVGGTNSWGNPQGTGQNWKASTTAPSATNDFDVSNVNTDIVEEIWRGADGVLTSVFVDCDTERVQGIFLDTFAILNTNLTTSAVITLIMTNDSTFATVGQVETLTAGTDKNIVWISPDLPITSYRYFRISIDDPTQAGLDNFISIGTIVFGAGTMFQGECFVDQVEIEPTNFTDEIRTEGQTTVQNDRGVKNKLRLQFKNIDYARPNYANIKDIFNTARTVLKCLWIPTPQYPKRYLTFGKLSKLPRERHNDKGEDLSYVDFNIEVDEAK
jgi:hypothetical protein